MNDSVWVLYSSDLNNYKLPVEAKFLKKVNKKDGKYEVLLGSSKIKVDHLYEKDDWTKDDIEKREERFIIMLMNFFKKYL